MISGFTRMLVELGVQPRRITRVHLPRQSKKLIGGIKEIYEGAAWLSATDGDLPPEANGQICFRGRGPSLSWPKIMVMEIRLSSSSFGQHHER